MSGVPAGSGVRVGSGLLRGVAGSLGLNIASVALTFLATLVLANLMAVGEYGTYALVVALVNILIVPATLGLDRFVVRQIPAYEVTGEHGSIPVLISYATRRVLAAGVAIGAATFGGALLLNGLRLSIETLAVGIGMVALPLAALGRLRQATLIGLRSVVLGQVPETLVRPALLAILPLIAVLALGAGFGALHALGLYLAGVAIAFLLGTLLLIRRSPRVAPSTAPAPGQDRWLGTALAMGLVTGLAAFQGQADLIVLGALASPAETGLYAVAARGATLIGLGLLVVNLPLGPEASRLWTSRQMALLQSTVTRAARLAVLPALAVTLAFAVAGERFLVLFGPEFGAAYPALLILSLGQLANAATGSVGLLLVMTGHQTDAVKGLAMGAAANVILSVALVPYFGGLGAAVGSAASTLLWNAVLSVYVLKRLGIHGTAIGVVRLPWRSPTPA